MTFADILKEMNALVRFLFLLKHDKRYKIICWGLVVHFLLVFAAFDLYFASPLDNGMTPIRSTNRAAAERLVLFVADGLRAEALYNSKMEENAPFLFNIKENKGSWGVSHTRVPTESRPGHVAMLGGIYEDPSAILKGWKGNPVNFDSIVNQSSNAWCWGSPDIMSLFNKDNLPHIRLNSYEAEIEDFGKNNTEILDVWVFDKVEAFLKDISFCKVNCSKYHEPGNMFFLHLLGIDTAGHGYKPHSSEYISNIHIVDKRIKKIYDLFEQVFGKNKTTYVFTADHGMTDWGSHGTGSPHETETPFIAWGAGIRQDPNQKDLKQIDIAPLLASVIGINIPTNSLGKIPYNYLEAQKPQIAELLMSNTKQLLELFNIKRLRIKENTLIFKPYQNLNDAELNIIMNSLETNLSDQKYDDLIESCLKFMETLLEGLDYYHNYYQRSILVSISVGFIAWIVFLSISTVSKDSSVKEEANVRFLVVFGIISATICWKQRFSFTYYLYFLFPVVMFQMVLNETKVIKRVIKDLYRYGIVKLIVSFCFYLFGIELLVVGFFYRNSYTALLLLLAVWVFLSSHLKTATKSSDKYVWIAFCTILSLFPMLPVMKTGFNPLAFLAGVCAWIALFWVLHNQLNIRKNQYQYLYIQLICVVSAGVQKFLIEFSFIPADSWLKYLSWIIFLLPIFLIPLTETLILLRLQAIFFAFAPFYILMSPNFESLFTAVLVSSLSTWFRIESKSFAQEDFSSTYIKNFQLNLKTDKDLNENVFRRCFLFMVFIFVGFFGTGNIASMNSFDPMWVSAFFTVFHPFKMMMLILIKIMIPFVYTCCVFRAINSIGKENILSVFCVILMFSDLMVLQFLFLITNQGSWLDIGTSLSHFLIMDAFVIILLCLYGLAQIITTIKYSIKTRKL